MKKKLRRGFCSKVESLCYRFTVTSSSSSRLMFSEFLQLWLKIDVIKLLQQNVITDIALMKIKIMLRILLYCYISIRKEFYTLLN